MTRLSCLCLALVACKPAVDPVHASELEAWHRERIERLTAPDGWLSLAGLHWLEEGDNTVGSGADNAVRLPASAALRVGVLRREGSSVHLTVAGNVDVKVDGEPFAAGALASDREGEPTRVGHRRLSFFIIARGDRLAVRVKDPDSEARARFRGIERYPPSSRWRIEARFEAYAEPRNLEIATAVGTRESHPSPGVAVFELDGRELRLEPVQYEGSDELFFVFADETNRDETYGAGRFLYAAEPVGGRVVLDFNEATNPPCAFTPYATCPLPPKQNKLGLRVTAGEKRYGHGH